MLSKLFRSILVTLLVFSTHTNATVANLTPTKHKEKHSTLSVAPKQEDPNNIRDFFEITGVAHISTQAFKNHHIIKYTFIVGHIAAVSINCTIHLQQSAFEIHSLLRKLILFPFHVFW